MVPKDVEIKFEGVETDKALFILGTCQLIRIVLSYLKSNVVFLKGDIYE